MKHSTPTPSPDSVHLPALRALEKELRKASGAQNLISDIDLPHLWERHILDSLAPLLPEVGLELEPPGLWIDIGSGAGLPVLPLAICLPSWKFISIEPRPLRAQHLNRMASLLGLGNLQVLCSKSEALQTFPNLARQARVVSTRAVGKIPEDGRRALPFLRPSGTFLTFKHSEQVSSIDGYHPLSYVRYLLPGLDDPRTLVSATLHSEAET